MSQNAQYNTGNLVQPITEPSVGIPPTALEPSEAPAVVTISAAKTLECDPDVGKSSREPTGSTEIDWSGCSFEERGRLYQGYMPGAYNLPNDGEEQDRLDFQHAIMEMVLDGKLAAAPVNSPAYVLDIGAGTGIWCIEFAEQNPNSFVIGTDLSLIQPAPRTNNCAFILENSETADWMFPSTLDYVHMRNLGPCFDNIQTVIGKAYQYMTPGGWIDLQDPYWEPRCIDDSLEGTALQRWFQFVIDGGQRQGRDLLKAKHYKNYLLQAGFTNVEERVYPLPGGPWAKGGKLKQIGRFIGAAFLQLVDSYEKFLGFSSLSQAEIKELIIAVKKDIISVDIHWYIDTYVVFGQKPVHEVSVPPLNSIAAATHVLTDNQSTKLLYNSN